MSRRQTRATFSKPDFNSLFLKHVAASYEKQLYLSEIVQNKSWALDKQSGLLTFGSGNDEISFKAQILGTQSDISNTWVWAWGNQASNFTAEVLVECGKLRQVGELNGIKELTERKLECNEKINGHMLSMVASGVCEANAYYRGPYEGGAVFLLIKDPKYPMDKSSLGNAIRIAQNFTEVISKIDIYNHRDAIRSYFEYHKGTISEVSDSITATFTNGESISAKFLPNGLLEGMSTKIPNRNPAGHN